MVQNIGILHSTPTMNRTISGTSSIDSSAASSVESEISAFAEIPLTALSKKTRRQLSALLNPRKILRSEVGYERDWRGIAALSQEKFHYDETALSSDDPMAKVLLEWCSEHPDTATFDKLESFLGVIDRWDVCDDIYENLVDDAKNYNAKLYQKSLNDELASCNNEPTYNFGRGSDANCLTDDDVRRAQMGLPLQQYDAFVLYSVDDINLALELVTQMEQNPAYNFKLCLKDRNLLSGITFEHVAVPKLIEERCNHLIVILTKNFLKSPENEFLVNCTTMGQIESKTRKLIPLLYETQLHLPQHLRIYTGLKYYQRDFINFWDKLASSIRNVEFGSEAASNIYDISAISTKTLSAPTPPLYRTENNNILEKRLAPLPTPPNEIPSININGHAYECEDDASIKKDHKYEKRSSLRNSNGKLHLSNDLYMRRAHSTSHLNNVYQDPSASMSNISTDDYTETKKKKHWIKKISKNLKTKIFTRSSTKLQELA